MRIITLLDHKVECYSEPFQYSYDYLQKFNKCFKFLTKLATHYTNVLHKFVSILS